METVTSKWRVACVRIPRFPIGAVWSHRSDSPHWDTLPIALAEGKRPVLRAVTSAAARSHVRTGMSVPEAKSRCAALEVLAWDDLVIARELARASAAFLSASPQVSPAGDARGNPGTWWVGAGGFETIGGEPLLARTLLALAQAWHPRARVAIADSCVAARAATWSERRAAGKGEKSIEPRIVPPGGCAEYLARAPLTLVPMDDEFRESLLSLGLRTAGALAALDPGEVERRWGAEGLASWRLASGDDDRRPVLMRADTARFVSTELAMSAATMEPVLFIVRAALGQLVDALVHDGRAAAGVAITLTLDDARSAIPAGVVSADGAKHTGVLHTVTREVRPAKPVARVAPLFERCRAMLDQWTLTAPVCAVTVTVSATAPLGAEQGDLLAAAWRDPAAADAAFERLRATLGAGSVVRPVARDEHRPEKAGEWVAAMDDGLLDGRRRTADGGWDGGGQTAVSSRLLDNPESVDVEAPRGVPRTLWWRGRRVMITRSRGPERLSGDWWKDSYAREYWRCESDELARDFLLYRDAAGWCLQGWYD
jgi:protein ImuB